MTHGPPGDDAPGPAPPDGRRDWDQFSKVAVAAGLAGLLAQARIDVPAHQLRPVQVRFPATVREVDDLFAGPDGLFVHVEIQQRPDLWMGPRMIEYLGRMVASPALRGRIRVVKQIVIQLSGAPMPTHHDFGDAVLDFRLLHTPTMPLDVFLATPALAPFGLTSGDPRAAAPVVERISEIADTDLRASTATLALFLAPHLRDTLIELMRRTALIDTREEMLAEMRPTWLGQLLVTEGRDKGRQEGRQEGLFLAVVDTLTVRFPEADADQVERTARRLIAQDGSHPVRLALALPALDS